MNILEKIHQETMNRWHFDERIHQKREFRENQMACTDISGKAVLAKILRARRYKFKISITHLSFLLDCSRTQYRHMEKGENKFSDYQLEVLATLFGDDVTLYKDSQEIENLLNKIDFYNNPAHAIRLLKLTLQMVLKDTPEESYIKDNSFPLYENPDQYIKVNSSVRNEKLRCLIKNLEERLIKNDSKMTAIGDKLMSMDTPEKEQIPLREKFHLLEDEQISIQKFIEKLNGWLKPKEESD